MGSFKSVLLLGALVITGCKKEPAAAVPAATFEPQARALLPEQSRTPKVVVRASGDLFALVARKAGDGADAVLLTSMDGGDHFLPLATLNTVPGEVIAHGEISPRLLLGPRSEFYAVWTSASGLKVARSLNFGRSFEAPITVSLGMEGAPSFHTAEVAPDGTLLVAWLGKAPGQTTPPGTSHLMLASSRDKGGTFQVLPPVASGVCPCCRPSIAADATGRWYLSWRSVFPGSIRDMVAAASRDRGASWSKPVPVSLDGWKIEGCPHSGPALQVVGPWLYVAWYSAAGGEGRVWWTRSPREGLAFEPRQSLSGELKDANHPSLSADGDQVWAAFAARDPLDRAGWGPPTVFVRPLGTLAVAPLAAPRAQGSASHPQLMGMGAGRWLVSWTDQSDTGVGAVAARFRVRPATSPPPR